ncbi:MAG: hypothetical protein ABI682_06215 [Acidobacteriota bacterium]
MFTILVVSPDPSNLAGLLDTHPSVEFVRARDAEEALEKLGRNRRVDAILLLSGPENAAIAEEIREDNPAPPPLFTVEGGGETTPPSRRLPAASPQNLVQSLIDSLSDT